MLEKSWVCEGIFASDWRHLRAYHSIRIKGTLRRREAIQRIRVSIDTRRRIRLKRTFIFSSTVSVDLNLTYEKCHGICRSCGFLLHGPEGCDQTLLVSAAPSPTDEVASAGISGGAKSGEVVLRMAGWKEATGLFWVEFELIHIK
ncbi:hypothetical protein M0R45_025410 [Rubus argutus]|uniref:Zinc knuckle CX2CX4HX4C domain-containing protein n=1 Tax=Rubus argutus TaxID=59490 RepID=A0AAW1WVX4_RUBAR